MDFERSSCDCLVDLYELLWFSYKLFFDECRVLENSENSRIHVAKCCFHYLQKLGARFWSWPYHSQVIIRLKSRCSWMSLWIAYAMYTTIKSVMIFSILTILSSFSICVVFILCRKHERKTETWLTCFLKTWSNFFVCHWFSAE